MSLKDVIASERARLNKKLDDKLPSFLKHNCGFTRKSLEQSSSELTANYKATLFSGEKLLELAGGLGIDGFALTKSFKKIISVDNNAELNKLVRENFQKLGVTNYKRLDRNAYDFINSVNHYDLIYLDADRRPNASRKFLPEDSEPNILKMIKRLFELTDRVLVKLSPIVDIAHVIRLLPKTNSINVVSVENEVKEVLVLLGSESNEPVFVSAVDIDKTGNVKSFQSNLQNYNAKNYSNRGKYFYEPSASLIKSDLALKYCDELGVYPLVKNSMFFLSDNLIGGFFGRKFKVIGKVNYKKSSIQSYFKENKIISANVSKRNFPLTVNELRKLFKLKDGGENYLFFTTGSRGDKLMFHCRKS